MPTSRPVPTQDSLGAILEYYSDIDDLRTEMEEWRDSMPDSLQSSDKYSQVEEAADTLGNAYSELESACSGIISILEKIPKDQNGASILGMSIKYTEHKMYKGYNMPRWVRLANACSALEAAMQFIEEKMETLKKSLPEDQIQELDSYREQADEALSDLQDVEFPSMYG